MIRFGERAVPLVLLGALLVSACGRGSPPAGSPTPGASPVSESIAKLNTLAVAVGCSPLQSPPDDGKSHTAPPQRIQYRTAPPTSGTHYPAPAATGIHQEAIPNEEQVHNLEHGHVGFQYNGLDPALVSELDQIGRSDPRWVFVAPYPQMRHKAAFTAWGRLLACDAPDSRIADVASAFLELFRDNAPESIPGTPAS